MIHQDKTDQAFDLAKKENLYERLGVTSTATQEQITKAYRQLALALHPDRNPNRQDEARKAFARINEANEVLSDPTKRREYDGGQARRSTSSRPEGSWAEGAEVDPRHRENYKSGQRTQERPERPTKEDFERELRAVYRKALELYSIEPTPAGVRGWLANPPKKHCMPSDFERVLKAATSLELIDGHDLRETPTILHNLKKALAIFEGFRGSKAHDLEKLLKERGIWDERFFDKHEIQAAREVHAQERLAKIISTLKHRFNSLKTDLISSHWISSDAVKESSIIKVAMSSLASGIDRLLYHTQYAAIAEFQTQEVREFLAETGLALPEECKLSLTKTYATWISKHLERLSKRGWGVEADVKALKKMIRIADSMGLSVGAELKGQFPPPQENTLARLRRNLGELFG